MADALCNVCIVTILIGGIIGGIICPFWMNWRDTKRTASFIMPLEEFIQYYEVNPQRYGFCDYPKRVYTSRYQIGFSFFDYLRFLLWVKKLDRTKQQSACDKAMNEYLDTVLNDVSAWSTPNDIVDLIEKRRDPVAKQKRKNARR